MSGSTRGRRSEQPDGELAAGDVRLHERRLAVLRDELARDLAQLALVAHDRLLRDALRRPLRDRLHEQRERQLARGRSLPVCITV